MAWSADRGLRRAETVRRCANVSASGIGLVPRVALPDSSDCAILVTVVRRVTPFVRPDDVLAGLIQETGTVGDPFAFDRDALEQSDVDRGSGWGAM